MRRTAKPDKIKVPMSVGQALRSWAFVQGKSYSSIARLAGIDHAHMSRILNDQVGITADTALKLERATGLTALRLLMTQVKYDLAKARYDLAVSRLHESDGQGSDTTLATSGSSL